MLKNRSFIFIILLAMIACSNVTNQNGNGNAPGDEKVVAQEGYKEIQIGDSITVSVPDNWVVVDTAKLFGAKEECQDSFCTNFVCYAMEGAGELTPQQLGEQFLKSQQSNTEGFKLIDSGIKKDSSAVSFEYLLAREGLRLGGTTVIFFRGKNAIVFSFAGYNGTNMAYAKTRVIVGNIISSIRFY
tara:strand:- start:626 stop:1183 length:558 start_codon:yes stop_codon:yes gene_type:complete